jgi:hypothetical protein
MQGNVFSYGYSRYLIWVNIRYGCNFKTRVNFFYICNYCTLKPFSLKRDRHNKNIICHFEDIFHYNIAIFKRHRFTEMYKII